MRLQVFALISIFFVVESIKVKSSEMVDSNFIPSIISDMDGKEHNIHEILEAGKNVVLCSGRLGVHPALRKRLRLFLPRVNISIN